VQQHAPPAAPRRPAYGKRDSETIRAWAIAQGMQVSQRGSLPRRVITAYEEAHRR
jgi:hypothetical protein